MKVLDRQVFDRGGPSHVQAFLHAVLFPSVRLLVVHPQQTRSRTLTVAVTHPGTDTHNCSLTSSSDHTTIYPLGHWYSSIVQLLLISLNLLCNKKFEILFEKNQTNCISPNLQSFPQYSSTVKRNERF